MRIHNYKDTYIINDLANSMHKDPESMYAWNCLYVSVHENAKEPVKVTECYKLLQQYKHEYKEYDCDVIFCSDGDLLIVSREVTEDALYKLAMTICEQLALPIVARARYYNMYSEWRAVYLLLKGKMHIATQETVLSEKYMDKTCIISDTIPSLIDVFDEVRQARLDRNLINIMLVEDDSTTRHLVTKILNDDFAMVTAANAQDAVQQYMLHAPDIVFLDINLPDGNGFEVLQQLVSLDEEAYIVMFSGNCYLENVTNALTQGAKGFVAKPFKRERLDHYIQHFASIG